MSEDFSRVVQALQQYFGFTSFRPLQEEIIRDSLSGKDVVALLPTGGGKSLCFQLPAIVRSGLTVVVSPLIALMKDQVDSLTAAGVPATFLNSSLAPEEARPRIRGLHEGEFKLLYVAPERLMLQGFQEDLKRWNVELFAIDEAHCISEWGHDFRPDYRNLAQLRERFPSTPILALTATATHRVRDDIVKQLRLKNPARYVASFNRPNLTYRVTHKSEGQAQLIEFVRSRPRDAGIVYCQSRRTAETLATRLQESGIAAAPYHAGLDASVRTRHQDRFLRDQIRVICATIAFGMGINKPNVRFVVHYDLPKNLEGYYQETGRAGRDGLPSECLLLFGPGDLVKCERFIREKPDPREQDLARQHLRLMAQYAETPQCRRKLLLEYFGETHPTENCGACDNCLTPRSTWDATLPAQKLLSCVYRIREHSAYNTGLSHVIEVLTGAETQRVKDSGHAALSTYGIGKDLSRSQWGAIGRELIRLGYLQQLADRFNVVELTATGRDALRKRTPIQLTRLPESHPGLSVEDIRSRSSSGSRARVGEIACDEVLFERFRELRKRLADERDVPAYIILSDVALRQMARRYPSTEEELMRINGIGGKKLKDFGAALLEEIADHLRTHSRMTFEDEPRAAVPIWTRSTLNTTIQETLQMFRSGTPVESIAERRQLASSTVYGHLVSALEAGEVFDVSAILPPADIPAISDAFRRQGWANLSGALDTLGGRYHSGQLRICRALELARQRASTVQSVQAGTNG